MSDGKFNLLESNQLIEMLIEHELSIQANLPSLISSFDHNVIFKNIEECSLVLILEESPKNFGWGSEIVAQLAELNLCEDKKVVRIGSSVHPIPSSINLEKNALPNLNSIIKIIKSEGLI